MIRLREAVKEIIDRYDRVTILTHINPDADTLGTALGIYLILKAEGKQVEVVNQGRNLPKYLDFLPNFSKIKDRIDFKESLIVTCDTGSIDRLGFDLEGYEILNIDHHKSNTHFGTFNVVDSEAVSASEVAYSLFKESYTIGKDTATCFFAETSGFCTSILL